MRGSRRDGVYDVVCLRRRNLCVTDLRVSCFFSVLCGGFLVNVEDFL
jgi:hypothetical protein